MQMYFWLLDCDNLFFRTESVHQHRQYLANSYSNVAVRNVGLVSLIPEPQFANRSGSRSSEYIAKQFFQDRLSVPRLIRIEEKLIGSCISHAAAGVIPLRIFFAYHLFERGFQCLRCQFARNQVVHSERISRLKK